MRHALAPRSRVTRRPPFAPLATERLTLRPYRAEDAAELHRLINDWEVCRALAAVPYPYPRDLADDWIASAATSLAEGSEYHLAVTGKEADSEVIVGGVGLRVDAASGTGRLGYWVGRKFWGHGVAAEAAGRLARWALANLDLHTLEANVATDNAASIAVLRKIGFLHAGRGTEHFRTRDADLPVLRFSATRENLFGWRAGRRARSWPGCGNSPAASSIPGKRRRRR